MMICKGQRWGRINNGCEPYSLVVEVIQITDFDHGDIDAKAVQILDKKLSFMLGSFIKAGSFPNLGEKENNYWRYLEGQDNLEC